MIFADRRARERLCTGGVRRVDRLGDVAQADTLPAMQRPKIHWLVAATLVAGCSFDSVGEGGSDTGPTGDGDGAVPQTPPPNTTENEFRTPLLPATDRMSLNDDDDAKS